MPEALVFLDPFFEAIEHCRCGQGVEVGYLSILFFSNIIECRVFPPPALLHAPTWRAMLPSSDLSPLMLPPVPPTNAPPRPPHLCSPPPPPHPTPNLHPNFSNRSNCGESR
jgi:hypothetical protein